MINERAGLSHIYRTVCLLSVLIAIAITAMSFALPSSYVDIHQAKTVSVTIDGKPFKWDVAKYGNYVIGPYSNTYLPVKPLSEAMGFNYAFEKIRGINYIKIWFPGTANVMYYPVRSKSEDYDSAIIKNGKTLITVKGFTKSMYHVNDTSSFYNLISEGIIRHLDVKIIRAEGFKDLSKFYAYASKESLYFSTTPVVGDYTVSIVKPFTNKDTGLFEYDVFAEVNRSPLDIRFNYATGTDQAAINRANAVKAFVRHFSSSLKSDIDKEYLSYFTNNPIDPMVTKQFLEEIESYNPYHEHDYIMLSKTGASGYNKPWFREPSNIAGQDKPTNIGSIELQKSESILKTQVDNYVTNDKKLMGLFEEHLKKYPNSVHVPYHIKYNNPKYDFYKTGTPKKEDASPRMMITRILGIYYVQKDEDVAWVNNRNMYDLRREGMIWDAYSYIPEDNAVSITIPDTTKHYDELAAQLIEYTTGNKSDAAEIFKLRDQVMIAYLNYRLTPEGKRTEGQFYNAYHLPFVNKPYKLKSGTVIYLDMNGWYVSSSGPTVYIKKNLKHLRQAYYPNSTPSESTFALGFIDQTNTYVEPQPFSWGKYK